MRPWKRTFIFDSLTSTLNGLPFSKIILRKILRQKFTEKHYAFYEWSFLLSDWKLANHRALLLPSNISYKNAKVGKAKHLCEVSEFVSMSSASLLEKKHCYIFGFFVCSVCVWVRVRVRVCVCELMPFNFQFKFVSWSEFCFTFFFVVWWFFFLIVSSGCRLVLLSEREYVRESAMGHWRIYGGHRGLSFFFLKEVWFILYFSFLSHESEITGSG